MILVIAHWLLVSINVLTWNPTLNVSWNLSVFRNISISHSSTKINSGDEKTLRRHRRGDENPPRGSFSRWGRDAGHRVTLQVIVCTKGDMMSFWSCQWWKNLEETSDGETTNLLELNSSKIVRLREVQFCHLASKITIYVRQETSLKRRTAKNSDKGRSARSPWYGNVSVRKKD